MLCAVYIRELLLVLRSALRDTESWDEGNTLEKGLTKYRPTNRKSIEDALF
jgi:hypothetical protein